MRFFSMKRSKAGFTLTELMAVVIIVTILAALGLGSYRKAVERTRISDGVTVASNMMGSVDRYYEEIVSTIGSEWTITDPDNRPDVTKLDMAFDNRWGPCVNATNDEQGYCIKTPYFEVVVFNGYTDARRVKGNALGDYTIRAYSEVLPSSPHQRGRPVCRFHNEGGRDICISAGYTTCNNVACCDASYGNNCPTD